MNRIKSTLTTWMRSLPLRGEEGWVAPRSMMALMAVLGLAGLGVAAQNATAPPTARTPSRSTTIALTSDEGRLVVVNREANTVSIIRSKMRRATMSASSLLKSALAKNLAAWRSTLMTRWRMSPTALPAPSRWLT